VSGKEDKGVKRRGVSGEEGKDEQSGKEGKGVKKQSSEDGRAAERKRA
jgi:hypothetical protein